MVHSEVQVHTVSTPVGVETWREIHVLRLSRFSICRVSPTTPSLALTARGEERLRPVSVKRAFLIYECLYPLVHRMHLAVCIS